jgi:hypothetical protein
VTGPKRRVYQPDAMRLGTQEHLGGLCGVGRRIIQFVEGEDGGPRGATSRPNTWGQ